MRRPKPECRSSATRCPKHGRIVWRRGFARDRFGAVHPQAPRLGGEPATIPAMAFGRKTKTADSTTVAPEVAEADSPAATVVKPARTRKPRSKPTPPTPPVADEPPTIADPEPEVEIAASHFPTHDDEW